MQAPLPLWLFSRLLSLTLANCPPYTQERQIRENSRPATPRPPGFVGVGRTRPTTASSIKNPKTQNSSPEGEQHEEGQPGGAETGGEVGGKSGRLAEYMSLGDIHTRTTVWKMRR